MESQLLLKFQLLEAQLIIAKKENAELQFALLTTKSEKEDLEKKMENFRKHIQNVHEGTQVCLKCLRAVFDLGLSGAPFTHSTLDCERVNCDICWRARRMNVFCTHSDDRCRVIDKNTTRTQCPRCAHPRPNHDPDSCTGEPDQYAYMGTDGNARLKNVETVRAQCPRCAHPRPNHDPDTCTGRPGQYAYLNR